MMSNNRKSGTVLVDGKDIREYNLTALRQHIGFVTQEPVLFGLTVKENLLLAKPDATETEIWEALKQARAEEFVRKLPKQLETYVGASGSQLSGGQKQRLCIARSLLPKPSILLMDEATSALDNKTERDLMQILTETAQERRLTTVTVAHRLATVVKADRIHVLDEGRLVEEGTHGELLQKQGFYSKLARIQLGENQEAELDPTAVAVEGAQTKVELETAIPKSESVSPSAERPERSESAKDESAEKENNEKQFSERSRPKLWEYVSGHWGLLISGCVCSLVCGSMMPIFAIPLAWMIDILSQYDAVRSMAAFATADLESLRNDTTKVVIFFFPTPHTQTHTSQLLAHFWASPKLPANCCAWPKFRAPKIVPNSAWNRFLKVRPFPDSISRVPM